MLLKIASQCILIFALVLFSSLSANAVTITEFSTGITPFSVPQGIATGSDGNLWFTEFGNRIGQITPAGIITEFSAGITGTGPDGITAGPDGNLWFTEPNGNAIGRITTSGIVSEFSVAITSGSFPYGITAGPDGNLWFTESSGNRIGMISQLMPPTATAVPIMTEWGMITFTMLAGLGSVFYLRRQRKEP